MITKRRVAITGLGVVSPLGNDVQSTWNGLMTGQSGIAQIQQFDASGFPARIVCRKILPQRAPSGRLLYCHSLF